LKRHSVSRLLGIRMPELEPHRALQFRLLCRQLPLNLVLNAAMLLAAQWLPWASAPLRWLCTAGIGLVCLALLGMGWYWRPGAARAMPLGLPWLMGGLLAFSGGLYALGSAHNLPLLPPEQQLLLVGMTSAFMAGSAWSLCSLKQTGLGWCVGIGGSLFLLWLPQHAGLAVGAALHTVFLATLVMEGNRQTRERVAQQLALTRQGQLLDVALREFEAGASDWLWELDHNGRLSHVSSHLVRALDRPALALTQRNWIALLRPLCASSEGRIALAKLKVKLSQGLPFSALVLPLIVRGQRCWWSLRAKPIVGEQGQKLGWRGVVSDITALQLRDEALRRLSDFDTLTGLASRLQFQAVLAKHWPQEGLSTPCALVLIDLDNFKSVNDTLGHDAGDSLLHGVAQRLQTCVAPPQLLARLGGDEFALLMPGTIGAAELIAQCDALRAVLREPFQLLDRRIHVHMSLGAALAPLDAQSAGQLMRHADLALYAAKAAGRNQLACFEPHLEEAAQQRLALGADLRLAIEGGHELENAYQPKFDLRTGALVGAEALARWQHPIRGHVPPANFVPLAEETGLILPLGEAVLRRACWDALSWPADISLAVNVSAVQVERCDMGELVADCLRDSGLEPRRLEIELTESIFLGDSQRAQALLARLKQLGVRVALDDFGTGYSSLGALQSLPLDTLKIDRSFVMNLDGQNPKAAAIVRTVVQLAAAIGARTVAEGIETETQRAALTELGCDVGQGYLLAPPISAQAMGQRIETQCAAA
jgi:diguanylate cyclase (GGDEF)-like protein